MIDGRLVVAFDVDDTLIVPSVVTGTVDTPNYETIAVYNWFKAQGCFMVVWSGSGHDWAVSWATKLGLEPDLACFKGNLKRYGFDVKPDIAFDDCKVDLGKVNVQVKRFNNSVSRKEWNKKEQA